MFKTLLIRLLISREQVQLMKVPCQNHDGQQQNREAKTHEVKTSQSFRQYSKAP